MAKQELKLTSSSPMIGLVAQEVEEVFPTMVKGRGEEFRSVNYMELGPVLLEAVKELEKGLEEKDAEIQQLREEKDAEIQQLREKTLQLEARLDLVVQSIVEYQKTV